MNDCKICGKTIKTQIRKGSGYCGGKCAKKDGKL